jgi:hypothetical protein
MGSLRDFFRKIKEAIVKPAGIVSSPHLWYVKVNLHTRRAEEVFKCEVRDPLPVSIRADASIYNSLRDEYDNDYIMYHNVRKRPGQIPEYPQLVWTQCSHTNYPAAQQTPGRAGILVETEANLITAVAVAETFFKEIWP